MGRRSRIPVDVRRAVAAEWLEGRLDAKRLADKWGISVSAAWGLKPQELRQHRSPRDRARVEEWIARPERCVAKVQSTIEGSAIKALTPAELMGGRAATGRRRLLEA